MDHPRSNGALGLKGSKLAYLVLYVQMTVMHICLRTWVLGDPVVTVGVINIDSRISVNDINHIILDAVGELGSSIALVVGASLIL